MDKGPLRILLVEDDPDDYLLTRELLEEIPGSKIALRADPGAVRLFERATGAAIQ